MSTLLETRIRRNSSDFEQNTRRMVDLLTEIKNEEARLQEGGGAKASEAQHKKGRLTARELTSAHLARIRALDRRGPAIGACPAATSTLCTVVGWIPPPSLDRVSHMVHSVHR